MDRLGNLAFVHRAWVEFASKAETRMQMPTEPLLLNAMIAITRALLNCMKTTCWSAELATCVIACCQVRAALSNCSQGKRFYKVETACPVV